MISLRKKWNWHFTICMEFHKVMSKHKKLGQMLTFQLQLSLSICLLLYQQTGFYRQISYSHLLKLVLTPINKEVVQRSRPYVSVKNKLSCSLVETDEQYPIKAHKDNRAFSQYEHERKVNGAIKKNISVKEKVKPKQISRAQGNDLLAHALINLCIFYAYFVISLFYLDILFVDVNRIMAYLTVVKSHNALYQ